MTNQDIKQDTEVVQDYSKYTNEQLVERYEYLNEMQHQDNLMDGSGECGGIIHEFYAPQYNAIIQEAQRRGFDLFGRELSEEDFKYRDEEGNELPY